MTLLHIELNFEFSAFINVDLQSTSGNLSLAFVSNITHLSLNFRQSQHSCREHKDLCWKTSRSRILPLVRCSGVHKFGHNWCIVGLWFCTNPVWRLFSYDTQRCVVSSKTFCYLSQMHYSMSLDQDRLQLTRTARSRIIVHVLPAWLFKILRFDWPLKNNCAQLSEARSILMLVNHFSIIDASNFDVEVYWSFWICFLSSAKISGSLKFMISSRPLAMTPIQSQQWSYGYTIRHTQLFWAMVFRLIKLIASFPVVRKYIE